MAQNALHGQTTRTRALPGLTLTETTYPAGLRLATHSHPLSYVCLVLQGCFTESCRADARVCGPHTVVLHPEYDPHANVFHAPSRCLNVVIDSSWLARMSTTGFRDRAILHAGAPPAVAARIYEEFLGMDVASRLIVEGLTLEILGQAERETGRGDLGPGPAWLRRVRDLLHDRFAEPLTLAEIAANAGVHETHLARVFRRYHGRTIGEYVRDLRLAFARSQLAGTTRPLSAIAADAGFSDQSHLTRRFKRRFGMTPTEYRRMHSR